MRGEAPDKTVGLRDVIVARGLRTKHEALLGESHLLGCSLIEADGQAENALAGDPEQTVMAGRCQLTDNQLQTLCVVEDDLVVGDLPEEKPARRALEPLAVDDMVVTCALPEKVGEI